MEDIARDRPAASYKKPIHVKITSNSSIFLVNEDLSLRTLLIDM